MSLSLGAGLPLLVGLVQRPDELALVVLLHAGDVGPRGHDLEQTSFFSSMAVAFSDSHPSLYVVQASSPWDKQLRA